MIFSNTLCFEMSLNYVTNVFLRMSIGTFLHNECLPKNHPVYIISIDIHSTLFRRKLIIVVILFHYEKYCVEI